jgi:DNA-binding NarL/FixJ family response regulator
MTAEGARILIADDHELMRRGIRLALEEDAFEVVAEAADAWSAVEEAKRTQPDICLVDLEMPGGGIAAIRELTSLNPDVPVIVLTISTSDEDLFAALAAGAFGYIPKGTASDRLGESLRAVMRGEAALPRRLTATLISEFRRRRRRHGEPPARPGPLACLTDREAQVLDLLARGEATYQIAAELGITDVTVRRHLSAIVRKLDVKDRRGAVVVARRASLVES